MKIRFAGGVPTGLIALAWLLFVLEASAGDKTVTEEILDILRSSGQVSEEKYQELKKRSDEEAAAQSATHEAAQSPPSVSSQADDPTEWQAKWSNGIKIERNDGYHKLKIGGRIQADFASVSQNSGLNNYLATKNPDNGRGTGVEFRRARIFLSGTLYDRVIFKANYDFADGSETDFKDVYIGLEDLGFLGTLKVGHFKEPFSLEELTSSKFITFMERGLPNALVPSRNTGFQFNNAILDERATWAIGGFREVGGNGSAFGKDGEDQITFRLTGLPLYADDGENLVHLGLGYSHKFRNNDAIAFATEPEVHLARDYVDTDYTATPAADSLFSDGLDILGAEVATVLGPFSVQAESMHTWVEQPSGPDLEFWGAYVQASYFLTGEHRVYKKSAGAFDRVSPAHNFGEDGGCGAWELALRFSYLDLNDKNVRGGKLETVTAGVNWYLFPNVRLMNNYVYSRLEDQGKGHSYQIRAMIDF